MAYDYWNDHQLALLREGYPEARLSELAEQTGHTVKSIRNKAKKLHLGREVRIWEVPERRDWTAEQLGILKERWAGMNAAQIGAMIGKTAAAVNGQAGRLGLKTELRRIPDHEGYWSPEDDERLRSLYEATGRAQIAALMGRNLRSIHYRVNRLGLVREGGRPQRKLRYKMDSNFFSPLTPASAYVLGFILADGCLTNDGLTIASTDREIIDKIRDAMGADHTVTEWQPKKSTKPAYQFTVFDRKVIADIKALGLTERKSLTATLPAVPDELFWHFLRGYCDGDGSIGYRLRKKGHDFRLSFSSGSEALVLGVRAKIQELSGIGPSFRTQTYAKSTWFVLDIYGRNAEIICSLMYEEADDLLLSRKKETYRSYATRGKIARLADLQLS